MTDRTELKRLAEAFPSDLDWDSNTEPFFNGPSGESLGGGATGFYSVYGKPFRLEGEDYDYDGPTYVEACTADFAKFMVAAREGILALIAENDSLRTKLIAEQDQLEKDAARYRWLRDKSQAINQFYLSVPLWFSGIRFRKEDVDSGIDAAMGKGSGHD
ncbi:hypothetical protein [Pseudomonas sp. EA_15y_Pfl1_P101]|uniref:hypothetical protein n=1 Tax=Pseudomonas sp. EA_15y_Pfl1_P101 TaxID=3088684 RepID=UPI0030D89263